MFIREIVFIIWSAIVFAVVTVALIAFQHFVISPLWEIVFQSTYLAKVHQELISLGLAAVILLFLWTNN